MHPSTKAIRDIVIAHGLDPDIRTFDASTRTAADAAAVLGCDVGAIASSLVFLVDDQPTVFLTSGAHRVDTEFVARTIGAGTIARASADDVRAATSQPIGGVAPVGHPARLTTYIDRWLARHDQLWCAAGTPNTVMSVTYRDLLALTGGAEIDVEPPGASSSAIPR